MSKTPPRPENPPAEWDTADDHTHTAEISVEQHAEILGTGLPMAVGTGPSPRPRAAGGIAMSDLVARFDALDDEALEREVAPMFLVLFVGAFALERTASTSETMRYAIPSLVGTRRLEAGATAFPVRRGVKLTIGRAEGCGVEIDHRSISRHHAELTFDDDGARVTDTGSRNGTWVGGRAVEKGATRAIQSGDELRVGDVRLTLLAAPVLRIIAQRLR